MAKFIIDKKAARRLAKSKPDGNSWLIYKRLLGYVRPYKGAFIIAVLANIAFSGIDSTFAYLLKPILNKGFITPDQAFLKWIPLLIIGLFILRSAMNLVGSYAMGVVARSVVMGFRRNIFDHFLRLPCSFYDQTSSGQLLST